MAKVTDLKDYKRKKVAGKKPNKNRHKKSLKKKYERVDKILQDFKGLTALLQYQTIFNYSSRSIVYQHMLNLAALMRTELYKELASDRQLGNILMDEIRRNRDFHAWVNIFGWTHNPIQTANSQTPFILYQFHVDFWETIQKYPRTIIIKSRGMGYTWIKVFIKVFRLLFDDDYKGMVASRVEGDVDKTGDLEQSIFGRIRNVLMNLPYLTTLDVELDVDKYLYIRIGTNTIVGYSASSDGPRSGRGTEFDLDEAGVVDDFEGLMHSIVSVSNEIRIGGTVKGTGNGFYDYWENKENSYKHIFWGHTLHPIFSTEDWVRREKAKYNHDMQAFEQEVLGNFFAMVGNKILLELRESTKVDLSKLDTSNLLKCVAIDPASGSSLTAMWYFYYSTDTGHFYFTQYQEIKNALYDVVYQDIIDRGFQDAYILIDSYAKNIDGKGLGWAERINELHGYKNVYLVDNKDIRGSTIVANKNLRDGFIYFNKFGKGIELGFKRLAAYIYVEKRGVDKVDKRKLSADGGDAFRYAMAVSLLFPSENNKILLHNRAMRGYNRKNKSSADGYNPLTLYKKRTGRDPVLATK